MARQVKGILFLDYVRMIRGHKGVDWNEHLAPEDLGYLEAAIDPDAWYPMEAFERLGVAILREVAKGKLEAVRAWGWASIDQLREAHPNLVAPRDPVETLMRFGVFRSGFFDFQAIEILEVTVGEARVQVGYGMGDTAEEAAAYQTLGFFERLLEASGARNVRASFGNEAWLGYPATVILLRWS